MKSIPPIACGLRLPANTLTDLGLGSTVSFYRKRRSPPGLFVVRSSGTKSAAKCVCWKIRLHLAVLSAKRDMSIFGLANILWKFLTTETVVSRLFQLPAGDYWINRRHSGCSNNCTFASDFSARVLLRWLLSALRRGLSQPGSRFYFAFWRGK